MADGEPVRHLYVHVPFCPSVCPFCSFEVTERGPGRVEAYLAELEREAAATAARADAGGHLDGLDTIYLGGGTPSFLRDDELAALVHTVRRQFGWAAEVTLEIHPATVSTERVGRWIDLGITRFSVGVESADDGVLLTLGRRHGSHRAVGALRTVVEVVRTASSRRPELVVSADVMTAIAGQDVAADLRAVATDGVDHVSAYVLTVEPGTPFDRDGVEVDPDAEWGALTTADAVLAAAGFARYEVSNHARPGRECRHNLAYWNNDWWFGLGPGAASHLPPGADGVARDHGVVAVRRSNPGVDDWLSGGWDEPAGGDPALDLRDGAGFGADGIVAGLRRMSGVDLVALGRRGGIDLVDGHRAAIDDLVARGRITFDGTTIAATPTGRRLLDQVAAAFTSG